MHEGNRYQWNFIDPYLSDGLKMCSRIYLSSLDDQYVYEFWKEWSTRLPLVPIGDTYKASEMSDSELLVYGEDIFPTCKKISIHALWDKLYDLKISARANFCSIRKHWASVTEENLQRHSYLIQKYDQGYENLILKDKKNYFLGSIPLQTFRENFLRKNIDVDCSFFLDYSSNIYQLKEKVASAYFEKNLREIPIISDGKCVATGWQTEVRTPEMQETWGPNSLHLYWSLISDETIERILCGKKRILISSNYGPFQGFQKRFCHLFDISVYDDSLLTEYLVGNFDLLLYGADVWCEASTPKYNAWHLYADLLEEEIRTYLKDHKVGYYYLALESHVEDISHRIHRIPPPKGGNLVYAGRNNDYFVLAETRHGEDYNVIGGRRRTIGVPETWEKTIYFFGPCTAAGTSAVDEYTIESQLQKIINEHNLPIRVVNCGDTGGSVTAVVAHVNHMYRIMDSVLHEGDIVIHMGEAPLLRILPDGDDDWYFTTSQIFNRQSIRYMKCFNDNYPGHMNVHGYRVTVDFLWEHLHERLMQNNQCVQNVVPSFFSRVNRNNGYHVNESLQRYLTDLEKVRVTDRSIGAIVMNCNPFTKGHFYLIEKSLEMVDYLYVFVVEEDKSEFKFEDRFAMVVDNCKDFSNVKVLPSGKYMISSMTFAEYFQKDNLQDKQDVFPAKDIRLFGEFIAPRLNITKRFVGEEPLDKVTWQYNRAMKEILPDYGVELIEIPRKRSDDGTYINATQVRQHMRQGNFSNCRHYLTEKSYRYIEKNIIGSSIS